MGRLSHIPRRATNRVLSPGGAITSPRKRSEAKIGSGSAVRTHYVLGEFKTGDVVMMGVMMGTRADNSTILPGTLNVVDTRGNALGTAQRQFSQAHNTTDRLEGAFYIYQVEEGASGVVIDTGDPDAITMVGTYFAPVQVVGLKTGIGVPDDGDLIATILGVAADDFVFALTTDEDMRFTRVWAEDHPQTIDYGPIGGSNRMHRRLYYNGDRLTLTTTGAELSLLMTMPREVAP